MEHNEGNDKIQIELLCCVESGRMKYPVFCANHNWTSRCATHDKVLKQTFVFKTTVRTSTEVLEESPLHDAVHQSRAHNFLGNTKQRICPLHQRFYAAYGKHSYAAHNLRVVMCRKRHLRIIEAQHTTVRWRTRSRVSLSCSCVSPLGSGQDLSRPFADHFAITCSSHQRLIFV